MIGNIIFLIHFYNFIFKFINIINNLNYDL